MVEEDLKQDAWGSDDEPAGVVVSQRASSAAGWHPNQDQKSPPSRPKVLSLNRSPALQTSAAARFPSLRAFCLGTLACHVEEVVHLLKGEAIWLPGEVKACLLAAVRHRGDVTNRILLALVDSCWTHLDLARCSEVTERAFRDAIRQLPNLQHVDISGCAFSPAALVHLAQCCPKLKTLRVGGSKASTEAARQVMDELLPVIEKPSEEEVGDSWEDAEPVTHSASSHRLHQLQYLIWSDIPPSVRQRVLQISPRVRVNPSHQEGYSVRGVWGPSHIPAEARGDRDLDQDLWEQVGPQAHEVERTATDSVIGVARPHIAELFRQAYVERDRRLRAKEEKMYRAYEKRRLESAVERVVERWLDRDD